MSTLVFSGTAKFENGDPAFGTKVYIASQTRKRLFSGSKGIALVDMDGNWSFEVPAADIATGIKPMIMAVNPNDGSEWKEFIRPGSVYDIDFSKKEGDVDLQEVVITSTNKQKNTCEANGGKYVPAVFNSKRELVTSAKCIMPAKKKVVETSWWDKNKMWVIVSGSLLLITMTTAIIIIAKKNKAKNK